MTISGHFLPWRDPNSESESDNKTKEKLKKSDADFWETLLRLETQFFSSKKGKSLLTKTSSSLATSEDSNTFQFDTSPFGQLLSMLSSPVIRRSSILTDKLLRLLSLISVGQPDTLKKPKDQAGSPSASVSSKPESISEDHLKLAVEVLTSKSCSEEGLEDVNALLLNLSYGPEPTRDTILKLLLQGAQKLGQVVRQNVLDLQAELRKMKEEESKKKKDNEEEEEKQSQPVAKGKFYYYSYFKFLL